MIIARVNDYEINDLEYQIELKKVLEKLHLEQANREAREMAIGQLIDGYLLLVTARNSKIIITNEEIENRIIDYSLQYNSEDEFQSALEEQHLDLETLRQLIHNELSITKYLLNKFPPNEKIPVDKLQEVYRENKESFITQDMIKASHILIKGDQQESLQKIIEIRESIRNQNDFFEKAKECSECPSCCQSGNLGYFPRGKMVSEFDDVAFKLKVNEISQPVKTKFGYHLILVTEKKQSKTASFDDVKDALKQRLQQIDRELRIIRHLKHLRLKAEIEIFENLL
ncbi:MAG: peptidylprolyl isomerase [Candidatus Cloacimonetes bacterium]|nr:peptidylprolyl isomerase [Candidatus Cloacimonadota bacterium]